MYKILLPFLILICACSGSEDKVAEQTHPDDWMLLPFSKQPDFFPVLNIDTSSFFCPVNKRMVRWQDGYVFNPAAIVCKEADGKMIATKINGKYWMYWGETDIYLAASDNLVDWAPVLKEEKTGKRFAGYSKKDGYDIRFDTPRHYFKIAVSIREGRFDSELVEPGPPPMLTDKGIFFIYNASNSGTKGDTSLVPWEYTVGQVLFDSKDPSSIIRRCENYFLRAEGKNEITGQMNNTAFVEALINHKGKWIIYYVTGEAGIGIATCDNNLFQAQVIDL